MKISELKNRIENETLFLTEIQSEWHLKIFYNNQIIDLWMNKKGRFTIYAKDPYFKKRIYKYAKMIKNLELCINRKKKINPKIETWKAISDHKELNNQFKIIIGKK